MDFRLFSLLFIVIASQGGLQVYAESVYKHSFSGTPVTLDPVAFSDTYANKIVVALYERLYSYKYLKSPLEIKPMLALTMPEIRDKGLTIRIPIRKGIFFADDACFPKGKGRELIADDVVFSIKRHFDPKNLSTGRWLWADKIVGLDDWGKNGADYSKTVEGLSALDRYTVQIKLVKPYPQLIYTLAMGNAAVIPHEAIQFYGKGIATHPVGSGPWTLASFDRSKAVLIRNKNYRRELFDPKAEGYEERLHGFTGIMSLAGKPVPFVDKVEVYFFEQESSLWNSFSKGSEVQFAILPTLQFKDLIKSTDPLQLHKPYADKFHTTQELELSNTYFAFNMEHPEIGSHPDPVRNRRNRGLRCAIRKGFHWQQLINRVYYGIGKPFVGVVPPIIHGYTEIPSRESVSLDKEGAKALLREHGWDASHLPMLRYSGVGSVKNKQIFELFKASMMQIGYPAHKVTFDMSSQFGDYVEAIHQKRLMTFYLSWHYDFPDAQNGFQTYYGPYSSPGCNAANYKNAEYDSLFEKASLLEPGEERSKIFRRLNEILIDDCVFISGYTRTKIYIWHKNAILYPTEFVNNDFFRYVALK
jgi:ABC-type transport system substrate-binding protein